MVLEGKDVHQIAVEFRVTVKAIKLRLTRMYKFYKVKNRIELMALYINIPLEIRKMMTQNETPIVRRKEYKVSEQFGPLPIGQNISLEDKKSA